MSVRLAYVCLPLLLLVACDSGGGSGGSTRDPDGSATIAVVGLADSGQAAFSEAATAGGSVTVRWTVASGAAPDSQQLRWGSSADALSNSVTTISGPDADGRYSASFTAPAAPQTLYVAIVMDRDGISEQTAALSLGLVLPQEPTLVEVPGGTFSMGGTEADEQPVHQVTLSPYRMASMELSNSQYVATMNWAIAQARVSIDNGDYIKRGDLFLFKLNGNEVITLLDGRLQVGAGHENEPVVGLSWYGAMAWCAFLNERLGLATAVDISDAAGAWTVDVQADGYRLPTESEWEYAARGGLSDATYPWGDTGPSSALANYMSDPSQPGAVATVGSHPANGYGLSEMAGNINEWCFDLYGTYSSDPVTDPTGPATVIGIGPFGDEERIIRGGNWGSGPALLRCAFRSSHAPEGVENTMYGLRVVRGGHWPNG